MPRRPLRLPKQEIIQGDCLDVFRGVRGLGAIVTDMPAGIGFMGRAWDKDRGGRERWIAYWAERLAVARDACEDDAVGLFWALPRTSHWTATAVEDAGWRIRDVITHHFGQGWPKDKNALKPGTEMWIFAVKGKPALGIDACRVERGAGDVSGWSKTGSKAAPNLSLSGANTERAPKSDNAQGSWPTNLVLSHFASDDGSLCCQRVGTRQVRGTAKPGPNGGCVVSTDMYNDRPGLAPGYMQETAVYSSDDGTETVDAFLCAVGCDCGTSWLSEAGGKPPRCACGREAWWACPIAELDAQGVERGVHSAGSRAERGSLNNTTPIGYGGSMVARSFRHGDVENGSSASRFFPRFTYVGKAPSAERHAGCDDLFWRVDKRDPFGFVRVLREEWESIGAAKDRSLPGYKKERMERAEGNVHPTVKRLALMRWLHKLTGAKKIGDLCAGSGSGAVAACLDGIDWIGSEVSPQSIEIANARLAWWRALSPEARATIDAGKSVTEVSRRFVSA